MRCVDSFWLCSPAPHFYLLMGHDDQMAMISSLACIADYLLNSHLLSHWGIWSALPGFKINLHFNMWDFIMQKIAHMGSNLIICYAAHVFLCIVDAIVHPAPGLLFYDIALIFWVKDNLGSSVSPELCEVLKRRKGWGIIFSFSFYRRIIQFCFFFLNQTFA